jgi:lipoate-protein ligase A
MTDLSDALKIGEAKYKDKAVKSVRSRVTNISDHLPEEYKNLSVLDFKNQVMDHIINFYPDTELYELSEEDDKAIRNLMDEKYETWAWNFGYSPKYNFQKIIKTDGGTIELNLDVHDGVIKKVKFFGDYFNEKPTAEMEALLLGVNHDYKAIDKALNGVDIQAYFNKTRKEELLAGMF